MKKLTEIYGLDEGQFDDINRQLAGAQSVARDPRFPQQRTRVGQSGAAQRAQVDLDRSRSIFAKGAVGDKDWERMNVGELVDELLRLTTDLPQSIQARFRGLIDVLSRRIPDNVLNGRTSSGPSSSVFRPVGGLGSREAH